MATAYDGPSAREMIQNHTLVTEIIARANDPYPVLDANELAILSRFCQDPAAKEVILKDLDMVDQPGDKPGAKAQGKGSLAGFIVARAAAGDDILAADEIERLREWFGNGVKA
jgi:hypothetical protein